MPKYQTEEEARKWWKKHINEYVGKGTFAKPVRVIEGGIIPPGVGGFMNHCVIDEDALLKWINKEVLNGDEYDGDGASQSFPGWD